MTSKETLQEGKEWFNSLVINYKQFDFIVNRDYVFASITLEKVLNLDSGIKTNPYALYAVEYKDRLLQMIDFAAYLQDTFSFIDESKSNILLIIDISFFNQFNQKILRKIISQQGNTKLSNDYVAIKAGNTAEVQKIMLSELRLTPKCLRKSNWHAGVLGVRFFERANKKYKIQYLIDIEKILFNHILHTPQKTE